MTNCICKAVAYMSVAIKSQEALQWINLLHTGIRRLHSVIKPSKRGYGFD